MLRQFAVLSVPINWFSLPVSLIPSGSRDTEPSSTCLSSCIVQYNTLWLFHNALPFIAIHFSTLVFRDLGALGSILWSQIPTNLKCWQYHVSFACLHSTREVSMVSSLNLKTSYAIHLQPRSISSSWSCVVCITLLSLALAVFLDTWVWFLRNHLSLFPVVVNFI